MQSDSIATDYCVYRIKKGTKKKARIFIHGFRKYFKTRAEQSGMKPIHVEILMGHSVGISD